MNYVHIMQLIIVLIWGYKSIVIDNSYKTTIFVRSKIVIHLDGHLPTIYLYYLYENNYSINN